MSTNSRKRASRKRAGTKLRYVPPHPERPNPGEIVTRPLPTVATEAEMLVFEEPLRRLTRAVKEGGATPEMARDVSQSAGYAIQMVEPTFRTGKKVRRGVKRGGDKTGAKRKTHGQNTAQNVLAEHQRLIAAGRGSREVAGIIANKIGLSPSQVRKILAANRKPRTS